MDLIVHFWTGSKETTISWNSGPLKSTGTWVVGLLLYKQIQKAKHASSRDSSGGGRSSSDIVALASLGI